MSKKNSALLVAVGAMLGGAAAVGLSYLLKLKSFHDELDQDFHEYEEEDSVCEPAKAEETPVKERTYITLTKTKDDSVKQTPADEETAGKTPKEDIQNESYVSEAVQAECQSDETEKPTATVTEDHAEEGNA